MTPINVAPWIQATICLQYIDGYIYTRSIRAARSLLFLLDD
jgi:hypothetical protein